MNKITIIATTSALLFTFSALSVFAQTPSGAVGNKNTGTLPQQQVRAQNTMQNLKTRAQSEIDRRVTSLTSLMTSISTMKRLTDGQKLALTNGIQTEIANLNTLHNKISLDTDIQTLRIDVKSIVTSYRVYLVYLPEVRIISSAEMLLDTSGQMSALATKLQSRISETQSKGGEVISLQTRLTDMQAKLTDAQTQAQSAISAVSGLQPTGYPGNKGTLLSGRTQLQTARQDLKTARFDAQKIIQGLRLLGGPKKSAATPTTSTQ